MTHEADESAELPSALYELWDTEQLRRHVAILESELARMAQWRSELEALRRWKAEVDSSRTWKLASNLSRIRQLPGRMGRAISKH
ncbi:MAG TPA: hypothetical protein VNF71_02530 [Acidimicrobiales bacterium]|nr:hypothetical protein [Acidimicrobiales bacterium]